MDFGLGALLQGVGVTLEVVTRRRQQNIESKQASPPIPNASVQAVISPTVSVCTVLVFGIGFTLIIFYDVTVRRKDRYNVHPWI
jgi:hypothetical protein